VLKFHVPGASEFSPPQPAALRTCAGAVFGSLEKYAAHFSNPAFGVTEPNKAPAQVLVIARVGNDFQTVH